MSEESSKTPEADKSEALDHGALPNCVVEASGEVKAAILRHYAVAQAGLSPMLQFVESMDLAGWIPGVAVDHDAFLAKEFTETSNSGS